MPNYTHTNTNLAMQSTVRTKLLPALKAINRNSNSSNAATATRSFSAARQLRAANKIYDP